MKRKGQVDLTSITEDMKFIQEDLATLVVENYKIKKQFKDYEEDNNKKIKEQLLSYLEVLDAFDRIFDNVKQKEETLNQQMRIWIDNFRSVRKIFWITLKAAGVKSIENPEGKVIPGVHVITETTEVPGLENGTVVKTIQKGYWWNNEILRKEKVITVKN
jgi:molecular chaperone GrpE (heat shock protein)